MKSSKVVKHFCFFFLIVSCYLFVDRWLQWTQTALINPSNEQEVGPAHRRLDFAIRRQQSPLLNALRLKSSYCYHHFRGDLAEQEKMVHINAPFEHERSVSFVYMPSTSALTTVNSTEMQSMEMGDARRMRTLEDVLVDPAAMASRSIGIAEPLWVGTQRRLLKAFTKPIEDSYSRRARFTFIPKSASTLLRHLLLPLNVPLLSFEPASMRADRAPDALRDYRATLSVAFVRDPKLRIESAFRTICDLAAPLCAACANSSSNASRSELAAEAPPCPADWLCQAIEPRRRFEAFIDSVFHQRHFEGATHVWTQSYFLSATTERAPVRQIPIDVLGYSERLEESWRLVEHLLGVNVAGDTDVRICFHGCDVSAFDTTWWSPLTLQRMCYVYLQDYICLGYDAPRACQTDAFANFVRDEDRRRRVSRAVQSIVHGVAAVDRDVERMYKQRCASTNSTSAFERNLSPEHQIDQCLLRGSLRAFASRGRADPARNNGESNNLTPLNVSLLQADDAIVSLLHSDSILHEISKSGGVFCRQLLRPDLRAVKLSHEEQWHDRLEQHAWNDTNTDIEADTPAILAERLTAAFVHTRYNSALNVQIIANRVFVHGVGMWQSATRRAEAQLSSLYDLCQSLTRKGIQLPDVEFVLNVNEHYATPDVERAKHVEHGRTWRPLVLTGARKKSRSDVDRFQLLVPGWEYTDEYLRTMHAVSNVNASDGGVTRPPRYPFSVDEMEAWIHLLAKRVRNGQLNVTGWRGQILDLHEMVPALWNSPEFGNARAMLVAAVRLKENFDCAATGSYQLPSDAVHRYASLLTRALRVASPLDLRVRLARFVHACIGTAATNFDLFDLQKWRVVLDIDSHSSASERLPHLLVQGGALLLMESDFEVYASNVLLNETHRMTEQFAYNDIDGAISKAEHMLRWSASAFKRRVREQQATVMRYMRGESTRLYWTLLLDAYARLQRFEPRRHALSVEFTPCTSMDTRRDCLCRADSPQLGALALPRCMWLPLSRRCVPSYRTDVSHRLFDGADFCRLDELMEKIGLGRVIGALSTQAADNGVFESDGRWLLHLASLSHSDLARHIQNNRAAVVDWLRHDEAAGVKAASSDERALYVIGASLLTKRDIRRCRRLASLISNVRTHSKSNSTFEAVRQSLANDSHALVDHLVEVRDSLPDDLLRRRYRFVLARRVLNESDTLGVQNRTETLCIVDRLLRALQCDAQRPGTLLLAWVSGVGSNRVRDHELIEYVRSHRQMHIVHVYGLEEPNILASTPPVWRLAAQVRLPYRYMHVQCNGTNQK